MVNEKTVNGGSMAQKARGAKPKHVPQRTCIACRQVAGKRALLRLVRTENGVTVDPTGKLPGRGAYLHPYQNCWQAVLRGGRLEQALRTRMNEENRKSLLEFMATLPESEAADVEADSVKADSTETHKAADEFSTAAAE
jgi:predicted RNA-binding protein YlxR (DUF448 family)